MEASRTHSHPGIVVALSWWLTRLGLLLILVLVEPRIINDVTYYSLSAEANGAFSMPEYPAAANLIAWSLHGLEVLTTLPFQLWFIALALIVDAAFTRALHRTGPDRWPVNVWLGGAFLLGPLLVCRLDVLPAVAVGAALLAHARPRASISALACGAVVKVWPAVLVPVMVVSSRRPGAAVSWSAVWAAAITFVGVAMAGVGGLLDPLTNQATRGLQIESVLATPVLLYRAINPSAYAVEFAASKSWEISGPGVDMAQTLGSLLVMLAAIGTVTLIGALVALRLRGHAIEIEAVVWVSLTIVLSMMVTSRVLSPQYVLWLLAPTAAGLALAPRGSLRRFAVGVAATSALTHLLYPALYGWLLNFSTPGTVLATLALATRNVALVALMAVAARKAIAVSRVALATPRR